MFGTARGAVSNARRFVHKRFITTSHHDSPASTQTEVDLTKVIGFALAGGAALYFYRSSKEPAVKTAAYKFVEERPHLRDEDYLTKYKISSVKSFYQDKGGIGHTRFVRQWNEIVPQTLINSHSAFGDQYGAGIKTDQLGPRRQRVRRLAPLEE